VAEYEIAKPGVYEIPEDLYHRDPVPDGSLSQSGAKKLLQDGGPARFRHQLDHPEPPTAAMEMGTAAHTEVLGSGPELVEIEYDNWRGKKANDEADAARAEGKLPLLTKELATVRAMAAALREHKLAAQLLGQPGRSEASAFWQDPDYKIWRRLRWDHMPHPDPRRRPILADYKTTADASPKAFAKSVANFGYAMQDDWYCAGYAAIFGGQIGDYPAMAFIAQEKTPPYLVGVYQLHPDALRFARERNERAMEIYRDCTEAGVWPGYSPEIEVIDLPYWSYRED
jgi:hypothetical protein